MSEGEAPTPEEQDPPAGNDGEPGREAVAGDRGGQPGYDLDEGAAYEEAAAQEDEG